MQALDADDLRRTVGQGTGLIKSDHFDAGEPFERIAFPHQKSMFGGIAYGCHDRGRRCQDQRARTENDQNGDGTNDQAGDQPSQDCGCQGNDNDPSSPAVCDADDLRFACVGRLHQTDHALDRTVFADLGGFHFKTAELVDSTAGYFIIRSLIDRQGFTGHHGLIDGSLSGKDDAVNGNGFSRQNTQHIIDRDLRGRNDLLRTAVDPSCGLRRQMHKFFDTGARLGNRQVFQQSAELHDERDFTGREIFADQHGSNQRDGDQHIGFDIKRRNESDNRFHYDRQSAEDDGDPSDIERERLDVHKT